MTPPDTRPTVPTVVIHDPRIIRSLLREAGRQSDYYASNGDTALMQFWADLEAQAYSCRSGAYRLTITCSLQVQNNPIKGCE